MPSRRIVLFLFFFVQVIKISFLLCKFQYVNVFFSYMLMCHKYFFSFQIGSRSSVYSPESRVRKTGSFIYEDFMPTDGTDVKVSAT